MFGLALASSQSVAISFGLILGVAVVLIKFFFDRKENPAIHYVVLVYDLLKVTAVGLMLSITLNLYVIALDMRVSVGESSNLEAEIQRLQAEVSALQALAQDQALTIGQRNLIMALVAECTPTGSLNYSVATQILESNLNSFCANQ